LQSAEFRSHVRQLLRRREAQEGGA
jgi:hypothetical protein